MNQVLYGVHSFSLNSDDIAHELKSFDAEKDEIAAITLRHITYPDYLFEASFSGKSFKQCKYESNPNSACYHAKNTIKLKNFLKRK